MKRHPDFIIVDTDKNLGPAIMKREKYIKSILNEHLLNKDGTYQQISKEQADETLEDFAEELCDAISFEHEKDIENEL